MTRLLLVGFALVDDLLEDADGVVADQDLMHLLGEGGVAYQDLDLLLEGLHGGRLEEQPMQALEDVLRGDPPVQIGVEAQVCQQLDDALGGALILLLQEDILQ